MGWPVGEGCVREDQHFWGKERRGGAAGVVEGAGPSGWRAGGPSAQEVQSAQGASTEAGESSVPEVLAGALG